jgi:L-asparaginase II
MHQVVAEVWRNDLAESIHHGSVVALAPDGSVEFAVGQPDALTFPRSSAKPFQGVAMVRSGLDLTDELLALACASHHGEEFHVKGVLRILDGAGLTTEDLRCTPDLPRDELALRALLVAGITAAPLYMNCSGKHAAMVATCVHNGWPTETYLSPDHPLQQVIRTTVEEFADEPVGTLAVDGCGAPLFGTSLTGLARSFRRLALAPADSSAGRVRTAMNTYPEWVSGTTSELVTLVHALPGAVAKNGAEGVYAIGLPDGRAVALKIADGAMRATPVVLVAALARLGVTNDALSALGQVPVLGHGLPVGSIRPARALTGRK